MDEGTTASEAGQGVNGRCGGKKALFKRQLLTPVATFRLIEVGNEVLLYTVCHRS